MYFGELFLTRGRLPLSSFLCFVGGFSMGSWLTLFHQLQAEKDLLETDFRGASFDEPLLLLAVLILSAPANSGLRINLRSTWLRLKSLPQTSRVRHFFVIGTQGLSPDVLRHLEEESEREEDLLLLQEVEDSFENLTQKVLTGISLLSRSSPFLYLLKTDDDSFVQLDKILEELEQRESVSPRQKFRKECYYWGFFDGRASPQRRGKWTEKDFLLCDHYLPYALGGGYILSKTCTDFISKNKDLLKLYINEDVSVGTWLSGISTQRKHDERFDTEWESRGCSNHYLIQHKLSTAEMVEKYKNLVEKGHLCSVEWRRRNGYNYDWKTKPSECCRREASFI